MPSQEEYLDNLLKGIETENMETENIETDDAKESEMTGATEATSKTEDSMPQIDMSDMDELLQSALDAQKADSAETAEQADAIHPEETASMSEDEIDRLLQESRKQADNTSQQEEHDSNDDLIKMLESADDEGLSNLLDQVAPEPAVSENKEEQPEEGGKRGKKRKKKEKAQKDKDTKKKPGFFDRFRKKSREESQTLSGEAETMPEAEENGSAIPNSVSEESVNLTSPADATESVDTAGTPETNAAIASDNTSDAGETGGLDDNLDALLAGAFPQQADSTESTPVEPESADVMDILKAAGADIVDEPEQKKEKKGFFAKLLDLFTEEDEEEEEADQLQLSDENKKILEEMDKDGKKKKGKKEKKPKKEKPAKPKKTAKEKKKKEKPEKEDKPAVPEKKISPKKIIPIVVVCFSLGAVILLLGNFLMDYTAKRSGREAYYAGDYQACYQNLYGKELDETEQVMYSQSESILTIRMWLREYEVFVNEGSELEALDSLLQAVRDYPTLLNYATQWNAQDEVSAAFQDILNILSQKYQLSQEDAQQIANISDNVEYTKNVMMVLQKLGLGSWDFPQGTTPEEAPAQSTEETSTQLPDPLPEEKEIQQ